MKTNALSEVLGAAFALAAVAGIGYELYGHQHANGAAGLERERILILVGVAAVGMYFVSPRRTREFVTLAQSVVPVRFGRRETDPVAIAAPAVPVAVATPAEPEETAKRMGGE